MYLHYSFDHTTSELHNTYLSFARKIYIFTEMHACLNRRNKNPFKLRLYLKKKVIQSYIFNQRVGFFFKNFGLMSLYLFQFLKKCKKLLQQENDCSTNPLLFRCFGTPPYCDLLPIEIKNNSKHNFINKNLSAKKLTDRAIYQSVDNESVSHEFESHWNF